MPLVRGRGGLLLREQGGSLTFDQDCCCTPGCPGETIAEFTMDIVDTDNAWGGLVNLGPFSFPLTAPNQWTANVYYDSCDGTKYITCQLTCLGGLWGLTVGNPFNNQPWAGSTVLGGGLTLNTPLWDGDVVTFNFNKPVDADACGWGASAGSNFTVTFTRV